MKKEWAIHEQVVNKVQTRHKKIMNKLWTGQVMKKTIQDQVLTKTWMRQNMVKEWTILGLFMNKSLISHEQVMNNHEQVIKKIRINCEQVMNILSTSHGWVINRTLTIYEKAMDNGWASNKTGLILNNK